MTAGNSIVSSARDGTFGGAGALTIGNSSVVPDDPDGRDGPVGSGVFDHPQARSDGCAGPGNDCGATAGTWCVCCVSCGTAAGACRVCCVSCGGVAGRGSACCIGSGAGRSSAAGIWRVGCCSSSACGGSSGGGRRRCCRTDRVGWSGVSDLDGRFVCRRARRFANAQTPNAIGMPMNAMMKRMFAGSIDTLNSDQRDLIRSHSTLYVH
jgi:hypothetical protein